MTFEEIGGVTLSLGVTDYTSDDTPKTILERVNDLRTELMRAFSTSVIITTDF
ncbi:hypothetical protein MARI_29950 [Marinobacter sp. JH2]|nr:hypothetical protein [Marinobacter sp. JH2]QBM18852.1 hypothetical protein MARI_29950 [Marinobacter sp. JH2]